MTLAELQAKRNELAGQIRAFAKTFEENGKKWKDDAERQNWEKLNADYRDIMAQIDAAKRADEVAAAVNQLDEQDRQGSNPAGIGLDDTDPSTRRKPKPGGDGAETITEEMRCTVFQAWLRVQSGLPLKKRHQAALKKVRMQPHQRLIASRLLPTHSFRNVQNVFRNLHPSLAAGKAAKQFRALSGTTLGAGGALVMPETLLRSLEINMLAYGGMLQVAEVIRTPKGEAMSWPTVDDTSNEGEQIGENADVSNSGDGGPNPDFNKVLWYAYKLSSKMIKVPFELLEDSEFNLAAVLGELMGERLGRTINRKATLGSGANTFRGIVPASAVGVTAASQTAIIADEIIELIHSVDPAYRNGAGFMCHDSILLAIRLLKDGNGAYLWQPGLQLGTPDRIAGYAYTVNQHMASAMAQNAIVMLFGQFSRYKIREVGSVRFKRLVERYADTDQEGFMALMRADGNLLQSGTPPVKQLKMAA